MLEEVLHIIHTIEHLPSLPAVKKVIYDMMTGNDGNREETYSKLPEYISYDPSLTIEFLKIANSGSFGFKNRISSTSNALMVLEYELIDLIISQHPVLPELRVFHENIEDEIKKLVRHSIEVRILVENILNLSLDFFQDEKSRADLLTAATLHDLGIFFLMVYFPDKYDDIYNRIRGWTYSKKTRDSFVLPDHAFVSALLCELWNLPDAIQSFIAFHHNPWHGNELYRTGSEILYLADNISFSYYDIYYGEESIYTIDEQIAMKPLLIEIAESLNINMENIATVRMNSIFKCSEIYKNIGI